MPTKNKETSQDTIDVYALYDQFTEHPVALFKDKDVALDLLQDYYLAGRVFPVTVPASLFHSDDLHIQKVDPR